MVYVRAIKSATQAISAKDAGHTNEASRHWKAAGARTAGATASLAASMATGALIGSAFPIAGTIAGAAMGMAVAYASDAFAQSIEANPLSDIEFKLAAKQIKDVAPTNPALQPSTSQAIQTPGIMPMANLKLKLAAVRSAAHNDLPTAAAPSVKF